MRSSLVAAATAALIGLGGAAGCGLKGPLTMPEHSGNVVIRGPGQTATQGGAAGEAAPAPAAPGAAGPPPAAAPVPAEAGAPATPTAPASKKPVDERMPPPPLPGGNPGSAHGG